MSKSFTSTDPQNHNSENTWFTPKWLIDRLGGKFDLDPCTMSFRPYDTAVNHICKDLGGCGISQKWRGEVWLNPPYGKEIMPFIEKFLRHEDGGIALTYSRTGGEFFQKSIRRDIHIFFFRRRVRFISKSGETAKSNPGTDSCLLIRGDKSLQRVIDAQIEGEILECWNMRAMDY